MSSGLYSGVSGLALGVGLYKGVGGLWGGASGLIDGFGGFSPATLFAAGEQGGWYDSSDLSTMFQDTAGTTPVTATGQTVARINDKSGRGNHLTQATAASRPIYGIEPFGGRRNLLTWTEQFDNAVWLKTAATVTANSTTAPDGTTTADTSLASAGTAITPRFFPLGVPATVASTIYTVSFFVKSGTYSFVQLFIASQNADFCTFTLTGSGSVVNSGAAVGAITYDSVTGFYRISMTYTAGGTDRHPGFSLASSATATRLQAWNPAGTESVFVWGAQLEVGSLAKPYQRVTDQWNVTEAGVPSVSYVQYDGTDDWFISPTITPGIDKAQVFAGVRKLSDATTAALLESSTDAGVNAGSILFMTPPANASPSYGFYSRGSVAVGVAANSTLSFAAPVTSVVTGLGDIAADNRTVRVNGAVSGTPNTSDQGTGNYLAYPLYVGRRGGTGQPFNGRLYQLLVRFGANLDAATIAATEAFVETKTGAIPPLNATLNLDFLANAYEAGI